MTVQLAPRRRRRLRVVGSNSHDGFGDVKVSKTVVMSCHDNVRCDQNLRCIGPERGFMPDRETGR